MANQKISQLTEYTSPIPTDMLPIVDVTNGITKKISMLNMHGFEHASLSDNNTKTVVSASAEYAITFDNNDDLQGITHTVGDSKIYVPVNGDYLIVVTAVIDTTSNTVALFDLWVKINGVNLANSNTQVAINSSNLQQVLTINIILDLNAGQYFELFYHSNQSVARILAVAAQSGPPAIPACPSVILTCNRVSINP